MCNSKMFGTQEVLGDMSITETQAGSGNKLNIENPAKESYFTSLNQEQICQWTG